jgi:hypothetical protein
VSRFHIKGLVLAARSWLSAVRTLVVDTSEGGLSTPNAVGRVIGGGNFTYGGRVVVVVVIVIVIVVMLAAVVVVLVVVGVMVVVVVVLVEAATSQIVVVVKLSLSLIKHDALNTYEGMEVLTDIY